MTPPRRRRPHRPALAAALVALLVASGLVAGHAPTARASSFPDVVETNPFAADIAWLVDEGLATGYDDGSFRPQWSVTRAELAALLYRHGGRPRGDDPTCDAPAFVDVGAGHPFCGEIAWLADHGLADGYADGRFRPEDAVARQSLAALWSRLAEGDPTCPGSAPFTDVGPDHPFCAEIAWLTTSGVAQGYDDGRFDPIAPVSRQAVATLIRGLDQLLIAQGRVEIDLDGVDVWPRFHPDQHDYAMDCGPGPNPVTVTVRADGADAVRIDGEPVPSGGTLARAPLPDGAVRVEVDRPGADTDRWWFRCLPPDFPDLGVDRPGDPGDDLTLVTFGWHRDGHTDGANFVALLDGRGVPVWYLRTRERPNDAKILDDGTVAFIEGGGTAPWPRRYEVHRFDGTIVGVVEAVGVDTDSHELHELDDGDWIALAAPKRRGVDLRPLGWTDDETVIDGWLQQIDRATGALEWEWRSNDHLPVTETAGGVRGDLVHLNSVDELPDGDLVVSARNVGILRIDRPSGTIEWKLGGVPSATSLTVVGDPRGGPRFQHDARLLPDGTILTFDNQSSAGPPRVARYAIDDQARTATLVWERTTTEEGQSAFIGSARWQPDGHVTVAWGGMEPFVEEVDHAGRRVLAISAPSQYLYRAVPYPATAVDLDELRRTSGRTAQLDAPTDVVAEPGIRSATVRWSTPAAGEPITGYTVTAQPGGRTCTTTATSCTVSGLFGGTEVRFVVVAHNAHGTSITSTPSAPVTIASV